jgi:bifunctional non-homologous end joining protein LigD
LHEPKLDGWRLQAVKRGKDVALYSRNARDLTHRYESVAEAVRKLPFRSCALDERRRLPTGAGSVPAFSSH